MGSAGPWGGNRRLPPGTGAQSASAAGDICPCCLFFFLLILPYPHAVSPDAPVSVRLREETGSCLKRA